MIGRVVDVSEECRQPLTYFCRNSRLLNSHPTQNQVHFSNVTLSCFGVINNKIKVKVIKLIDVVGICSGTSVCALRLVGVTGRWLDFQFDRLACFDQPSPSHIRGGCRLLARSTSRIPRMCLCTCWHMQPGQFCQHNICVG